VAVVQNPTLSLAVDVDATHKVLDGPAVLVGNSHGGAVIAEVGHHLKRRRARLHHATPR
jgi:hypothetical protein